MRRGITIIIRIILFLAIPKCNLYSSESQCSHHLFINILYLIITVVKSATAVVSEGRMRIQERQTAHKSAVNTETVIRDDKGGQRYSRTPSSTTSVNLVTPSQSSNVGQQHLPAVEHYPKEINPFDENVVAIVSAEPNAKEKPSTKAVKKVYDRALDPFAADVDDETNNNNSKPTGSAAISYAKSLNPFE